MKHTFKKSIAVILATLMLLTVAPLAGFVVIELPGVSYAQASEILDSGTYGAFVWTLDKDYTLTIS
ncbi:MAG: hypothetical protein Q4G23_08305, partial [Clostridia bacterium]|nr:hypothetical protein [Clostridia bacterium]